MSQQASCPECHSEVRPSWDWCLTCGYDPAGLKPSGWSPDDGRQASGRGWVAPTPLAVPSPTAMPSSATPPKASVTRLVDPLAARPQAMLDPNWIATAPPPRPHRQVSARVGLVAVVAAAVVGVVMVTVLVMHKPVAHASGPTPTPATEVVVTS
jgi:hypothetical protein